MKRYEIRNMDLKGIFMDFEPYWELGRIKAIYRRDFKFKPETDPRHGAVLVLHERETDAEADKARLDWLNDANYIERFRRLWFVNHDSQGFNDIRQAIDRGRNAPTDKVTVIES